MESTISIGTREPIDRMSELHFDFDWENTGGARGEELHTWASLSIWIGQDPVTEFRIDKPGLFGKPHLRPAVSAGRVVR